MLNMQATPTSHTVMAQSDERQCPFDGGLECTAMYSCQGLLVRADAHAHVF